MKLSKDKCALVAQLDRVTGYEPVGQGFESLAARHQVHSTWTISRYHFVVTGFFVPAV